MRRLLTALLTATLLAGLLPLTALAAPVDQTITFGALADKTYGAAAFTITASTDSTLQIDFTSTTPGVCTVAPDTYVAPDTTATVTIVHNGTCTIYADQAGDVNFNPAATVPQSFTVNKATNTVTAVNKSITYGDSDPAFTFTYGAWKYSDTSAVVTSAPTCTVSGAHTQVSGSPYAIACSGAAADDYDFTYNDGTLTISKANPQFSISAPGGTYDGTPKGATGFAYGVTGVGEQLTPALTWSYAGTGGTTYGPNSTAPSGGGTYTATGSFAGNSNYHSGSSAATPFTIGQASQTIAFDLTGIPAKKFGNTPFSIAGTALASSGLGVSYATRTAPVCTVSGTTVTIVASGTCTIRATQAGNANYSAAPANDQSIAIGKADASCTVTPYSLTYTNSAHTATGSCTGVGGVTLSAGDLDLSHTTHTNAGTYAADFWTFTDSTGNYNDIGSTTITDVINAAAPSFSVSAPSTAYTGSAHSATGFAYGLGGIGDVLSPAVTFSYVGVSGTTYGPSVTGPTNVGSYTVTASYAGAGNYAAGSSSATPFSISQATQTITFDMSGVSKTFGDTTFSIAADASASSGLTVSFSTLSNTICTTGGTNGATVTIVKAGTCQIRASQSGNSNYSAAANNDKSFVIAKATATCTVTPYTKTYNAAQQTALGGCTGVGGAGLSGLDLSHTQHTNAGTYSSDFWSFTDATGNYNNIGNTTITDTINQAMPTVTVTGGAFTYTNTAHAGSGSAYGVGGVGDTLAPVTLSYSGTGGTTYGPSSTAPTAAGTYTVTVSYAGSANYLPNTNNASLTISPATASCTITPYSVTYDTSSHTAVGSCTGVGAVTLPPNDLDLTGTVHTNAGNYTTDAWTFHDPNGNYADNGATITDAIAKANPVCSVTGYTVTFNVSAHRATGSCTGVGTESATELATLDLSQTSHTNAGTYATDPWTFTDASGNYNNDSGTVADQIDKADQTISANFTDPSPTLKNDTFTPAGVATSGLPVTITVDITTSANCTINGGGLVTITGTSGNCLLDFEQSGNSNYNAAPQFQFPVSISNRKPVCTPSPTLDVVMNVAVSGPANCSDPDGTDIVSYGIGTDGSKGHATIDAAGQWTYTPTANIVPSGQTSVSDSFTVLANDGLVDSNPATIDVTISNHPVSGSLQIQHVAAAVPTTIDVLALVSPGVGDAGQPLTITSIDKQGVTGKATTDGHTLTYDPSGCGLATDAFNFTFSDGVTSTSVPVAVIVDRPGANGQPTKPVTNAPVVSLVNGSTIGATTPIKVGWCGLTAANTSIASYRLVQSTNGGTSYGSAAALTVTSKALNASTYTYRWGVRTVDKKAVSGDYAYSLSSRILRTDSANAAIVYKGTWKIAKSSSYSGGSERYASSTSLTATYKTATTARMFGIVAARSGTRGTFRVYVDGVLVANVSERASSAQYRRVLYVRALTPGVSHTIVIKPYGNGPIGIDAILTIQ